MIFTEIFIISIVALIAVVDVWLAIKKGFSGTISWFLYKHPIIPFLMGVLIGHLFWSQVC